MSDFNWNDHPVVAPAQAAGAGNAPPSGGGFSWDDHPVIQAAPAASHPVQAAVEGFGQGASMGYLPQLQAAASKPIYAILNAATGQDVQPDSYVEERDANIARQKQLAESNPKSYYGGMVAGAVATAPAMEAAVSKVAPAAMTATKLRKAATLGGAIGAAANPGDTTGEVSGLQLEDRAKNAGIGAVLGATADKAGQGLSKLAGALGAAPEDLATLAEKNALRSAGAQKTQMKQLINQGRVKDVGRFIIDENIVPPGAGSQEIFDNAARIKDEAGKTISDVFDQMEKSGRAGTFDRKTIAQGMRDALAGDDRVAGSLDAEELMPKMEKYISNFEQKEGAASARELLDLKGKFDERINYLKRANDIPEMQQGFRNLRTTLNEAINDRAQSLSNDVRGDLGKRLLDANKRYGLASSVADIAENKLAQEGNRFFSLTDSIAGAAGAGAGALGAGPGAVPMAAAGALANKALRTYGPALGTKAIDAAARAMETVGPRAETALKAVVPGAAVDAAAGEAAPATRELLSGSPPSRPTLPKNPPANTADEKPSKGPDKWAQDGIDKLKEHTRDPASIDGMKEALLKDPKAKQLLAQASDLKPGSKGMQTILDKVKERYGAATSKR